MNKKPIDHTVRIVNWTAFAVFFVISIGIIALLAYIFGGYEYVVKGRMGTDSLASFSQLVWIDKYFPNVPFWYPKAGAGMSIVQSYPVFSLYIVSFVKRLMDSNLLSSMYLVGFTSVLSMAMGIYVFVVIKFKNQTAALLASAFYIVSPLSWTWLMDWGFYAESVSHIFVMPAVIFWDLYYTRALKQFDKKARIYLLLTVLFSTLTFMNHFGAGLGLFSFYSFYVIGFTLVGGKGRLERFVKGLSLLIFGVGLVILATLFVSVPYYRYAGISSFAGNQGGLSLENIKNSEFRADAIAGFYKYGRNDIMYAARRIAFPALVSVFAVIGILLAYPNPTAVTLSIFAIFGIFFSINAEFTYYAVKTLPFGTGAMVAWRYISVTLRAVVPILAGYGIYRLLSLPFFWSKNQIVVWIRNIIILVLGISLVVGTFYRFGKYPGDKYFPYPLGGSGLDPRNVWQDPINKDICIEVVDAKVNNLPMDDLLLKFPDYENWCFSPLVNYFPPLEFRNWCLDEEIANNVRPSNICDISFASESEVKQFWEECRLDSSSKAICKKAFKTFEEQLSREGIPRMIAAGEESPQFDPLMRKMMDKISEDNPNARIDFSPYVSSYSMIAPYLNLDNNLSQIHSYTTSSILNLRFQGQESLALFVDNEIYGNDPDLIDNLTKWFGINYIFQSVQKDQDVFPSDKWEKFSSEGEPEVLKYLPTNSTFEISNKPKVLVFAKPGTDAYDQVFRLANRGVIPYDDAILVWSDKNIDDFDQNELLEFETIILYGYDYKNFGKTNNILTHYVGNGGNLFIDTGWQYTTPDWESDKPLDVIPFNNLSWQSLGMTSDYNIEDEEIDERVDTDGFKPLVYADEAWGVSTSDKSNLRGDSKVILSAEGMPLVVQSELGDGTIVWSGMNIFSHAEQGKNYSAEEMKLLREIFSRLIPKRNVNKFAFEANREDPDSLEIKLDEEITDSSLLIKEAFHPDFVAYAKDGSKLPVYRSGPSFVLVRLDSLKGGDTVVYQYKKPFVEKMVLGISILTIFILLPLIVLDGFRQKSIFDRFKHLSKLRSIKIFNNPKSWWSKEDDGY